MNSENRIRVVYLREESIVALFNAQQYEYDFLALPKLDLPDGYRVLRVTHSFERQAFALLVAHESFDEVQPGNKPPEHPMELCKVREELYQRVIKTIEKAPNYAKIFGF